MFQELALRFENRITKQDTWYWKALEPSLKEAIPLRHLASDDSYHSLMYAFCVAHNTISLLVLETCEGPEYAEEVISCPHNQQEWLEVARQLEQWCQVPRALGAMDGNMWP